MGAGGTIPLETEILSTAQLTCAADMLFSSQLL